MSRAADVPRLNSAPPPEVVRRPEPDGRAPARAEARSVLCCGLERGPARVPARARAVQGDARCRPCRTGRSHRSWCRSGAAAARPCCARWPAAPAPHDGIATDSVDPRRRDRAVGRDRVRARRPDGRIQRTGARRALHGVVDLAGRDRRAARRVVGVRVQHRGRRGGVGAVADRRDQSAVGAACHERQCEGRDDDRARARRCSRRAPGAESSHGSRPRGWSAAACPVPGVGRTGHTAERGAGHAPGRDRSAGGAGCYWVKAQVSGSEALRPW